MDFSALGKRSHKNYTDFYKIALELSGVKRYNKDNNSTTAAKTKTADILRYGESCRRSLHG